MADKTVHLDYVYSIDNDLFQALAYMGNASHQMALANTVLSDAEKVPGSIKVEMKQINEKIHELQEQLRDIRKLGEFND